ncbi:MAG TPA: hypothetical protein VKY29_04280, partial [Cryomorphaceae bacterium]|nr:hypothetical protein [Cryomorphaceae bacterium]
MLKTSRFKSRASLKSILRVLPLLLFFFSFSGTWAIAQDSTAVSEIAVNETQAEEESLDASKMILHHIADAHEIHLFDDVAIYLPVI